MESSTQVQRPEQSTEELNAKRRLTMVIYGLYGLGVIFGGLPSLVAIIMNYIKRNDMRGTWLESHFDWQIKTFWWGVIGSLISLLLMMVGVGFILFFVVVVWYIYRLVKGFLRLNDNLPI